MRDLTCDEVREMAGAFVLGALEPAEEAAVRAHLATCADAHAEIAELGGVLPVLAESVPIVEPPAGLKARIMAAAAADLAARSAAAPAAQARQAAPGDPASEPVPRRRPSRPRPRPPPSRRSRGAGGPGRATDLDRHLGAAHRGGRSRSSRSVAGTCCSSDQLNAAQAYEQTVAAVLDVAGQPGSLTAILTADGGTGLRAGRGQRVGRRSRSRCRTSPRRPAATVYRPGSIGGDGVPVAARQLHGRQRRDGRRSRRPALPTTAGVVLALTLEPGPGATTPTLPIISKGVATAAG